MPVNPAVQGRTYPAISPYVVSRAKIGEFAAAVGASDPAHTDPAVAQQRGFTDVIAPPTFAILIAQKAEGAMLLDPEAEVDFARLVHGEQSFTHHRPLVAGDEVTAATTVASVRSAGGHSMVTLETAIQTTTGEPVCDARSVLVIRGDA